MTVMTHDQQNFANFCWPTNVGQLFADTRAGKYWQISRQYMADSSDEDALLAFVLVRHTAKKKRRRRRRSTWVRSWIMQRFVCCFWH